jgi:pimeloyl-[acyl-carrier protein] methyl ester esterase
MERLPSAKEHWYFLRGLGRDARHWGTFPDSFRKGFPGSQVHTIDLPGSGENAPLPSPWSIEETAEFCHRTFLEQVTRGETPERIWLLAISLGALVGVEWMRQHPEHFEGAVLINTSFAKFSPVYHRLSFPRTPELLRAGLQFDLFKRELSVLKLTSEYKKNQIEIAQRWADFQRERPLSRMNLVRQLRAASRYRAPEEAPVSNLLLLNSLGDKLVDPRCSLAIHQRWNVPLQRHSEAGHDLPLDDPDWVIHAIRSWKFPTETTVSSNESN